MIRKYTVKNFRKADDIVSMNRFISEIYRMNTRIINLVNTYNTLKDSERKKTVQNNIVLEVLLTADRARSMGYILSINDTGDNSKRNET